MDRTEIMGMCDTIGLIASPLDEKYDKEMDNYWQSKECEAEIRRKAMELGNRIIRATLKYKRRRLSAEDEIFMWKNVTAHHHL